MLIRLARNSDSETAKNYAIRFKAMQDWFPFLRLVPTDLQRFTSGVRSEALDLAQVVSVSNPLKEYRRDTEFRVAPILSRQEFESDALEPENVPTQLYRTTVIDPPAAVT